MLLQRLLKLRNHDVISAEDAEHGLVLARSDKPDLILMDMGLPGMDGWEAVRQLKADPATSSIPVIALTAHAMQSDRERAVAAGCDHYETKPIDINSLFARMGALLARGQASPPAGP